MLCSVMHVSVLDFDFIHFERLFCFSGVFGPLVFGSLYTQSKNWGFPELPMFLASIIVAFNIPIIHWPLKHSLEERESKWEPAGKELRNSSAGIADTDEMVAQFEDGPIFEESAKRESLKEQRKTFD